MRKRAQRRAAVLPLLRHCVRRRDSHSVQNGKIPYAYYLSLATSPILFIIRMLFQTSETSTPGVNGAWRAATHYIVPGNIRAVMFLLLAASTIIVNKYRSEAPKPADSRVRTAGIMMFVNILLGVSIIMLQF